MHTSTNWPQRSVFIRLMLCLAAGCLGWGLERGAWAAEGRSEAKQGHEMFLTVDSRWPGNSQGGYFPIRIRVTNTGPACELTFRFEPFGEQQLPVVERRDLPIEQDATAVLTLSVPMVGRGTYGQLTVERDGVELDLLTTQIGLPELDFNLARTGVLIISPNQVSTTTFEDGMRLFMGGGSLAVPMPPDYKVLSPVMLPHSWTDYTGLEVVMISLRTLADLEREERAAILEWTQTGGTLVVYSVGRQPDSSPELRTLLNVPEQAHWHPANPLRWGQSKPSPQLGHDSPEPATRDQSQWGATSDAFARHDYLLGRVYAFPQNPFPGLREDWWWWWDSTPMDSRMWVERFGVQPRLSNPDFFNFLIPGVTSVPVYAFLVLMTLFTIVIGPLNYFMLRRRKRTYLLLLTIPLIAFVTSLTLFTYSSLAYGFGVASRSRSLTVLDQRANTAVSLHRLSLFAGLAPSEGLQFSPDTAVFPIWPIRNDGRSGFESGRTVWGERQVLTDGWLRSRTRTQFATVTHRTERGRLEIGSVQGGTLSVSNGLEWDIEAVILVDETGAAYQAGAIGAGNSGELVLVDQSEPGAVGDFVRLLRQYPLELPDDLSTDRSTLTRNRSRGRRRSRELDYEATSGGRLERKIEEFKLLASKPPQEILARRSYLAILAENPGLELGVEEADETTGYHLLLGHY